MTTDHDRQLALISAHAMRLALPAILREICGLAGWTVADMREAVESSAPDSAEQVSASVLEERKRWPLYVATLNNYRLPYGTTREDVLAALDQLEKRDALRDYVAWLERLEEHVERLEDRTARLEWLATDAAADEREG